MVSTIMTVIEENLDPRSVTNSLYELMVDWRSAVYQAHIATSESNRKKFNRKRTWIETTLSRFFNKDPQEMRALLEDHFDVKVARNAH